MRAVCRTLATVLTTTLLLTSCSLSDSDPAAQPLESEMLPPMEGLESRSFFGDAVAAESGVVAVGGWGALSERGVVALYEQTSAGLQALELPLPPGLQEGDRFGHALDIDGDDLVVAAPRSSAEGSTGSAGAVYHYRRSTGGWRLEQRLVPPGDGQNAHFGSALALEGGVLAVVAAEAGEQRLHIFGRGPLGWNLEQSFELDALGVEHSVAANADLIAVGARLAGGSTAEGNQGLVRLFTPADGVWTEIPAPLPEEPGECFGCEVALAGELLAVGSPSPSAGVAFVFRGENSAWQQVGRVEGGTGSAHFGRAIAVGGDTLVVGAPGDDAAGENVGRLFVYAVGQDSLTPVAELSPADLPERSNFGVAVATDGQNLIVGASGVAGAAGAAFAIPLSARDGGS